MNIENDLEKESAASIPSNDRFLWERMSRKLLTLGVESRGSCSIYLIASVISSLVYLGIQPVSLAERIDKPYSKTFFVWFSMNINILSYEGFLASSFFFLC